MIDNYQFKSELVKDVLPMGVTDLTHVRREEISGYLVCINNAAKRAGGAYIQMFVISRIDDKPNWTEESILRRLKDIRKDIAALKWKLAQ